MQDKKEILDEIKRTKKEFEDFFSKINKFDAILTLLAFREALNNELSDIGRRTRAKKKYRDISNAQMYDNVKQTIFLTEEMIYKIVKDCNNEKQELSRVPVIETLCTNLSKYDPAVQEWALMRGNPEEDYWAAEQMQAGGKLIIYRHMLIEKYFLTKNHDQILHALRCLSLFARYKSFETVINQNIEAKLSPETRLYEKFGLSPSEVLKKRKIHPRQFAAGGSSFPRYKENIQEIAEETLLSTELSVDSPIQQKAHDKEHHSFFNEFLDLPDFAIEFKKQTGMSLQDFRDVTLALKILAKRNDNAVSFETKKRLVVKLKKICKCEKQQIKKIIEILIMKRGDRIREKAIISSPTHYMYGWTTVAITCERPVERIYADWVDSNTKGVTFEEECRNLFKKRDLFVSSDRILIKKRIIPEEISKKLWNRKIKKWGELDVVGSKNGILFVLECKSELPRLKKSESQLNRFTKFYEELCYKSDWISKNFTEFFELISKEQKPPSDIKFVIPIMITSFIAPDKKDVFTFSTMEFAQILDRINYPKEDKPLTVKLESQIIVELPFFKII